MLLIHSYLDLYSLIKASPASRWVFLTWRKPILTLAIRDALSDTIHHALAILHVPKAPPGAEHPDLEDVKAFLDQYLQSDPWELPTDLPSIVFVDSLDHSHLSIQKGFLRSGIYCQICPTFEHDPFCSFLSPGLQFNYFLSKLEPWEVEEITCVYEYFTTIICRMENRFIQAVLTNPHLRAPSDHNLQDDRSKNRENSGTNREEMKYFKFEDLNITELNLFSTDSKYRLYGYARYIASLGFKLLEDLLSSDTDWHWDIIRRKTPLEREFLPAALVRAPNTLSNTIIPEGDFIDPSSGPSRGWFEFKGVPYDLYFDIHRSGPIQHLVRICSYVFWNSKRVLHSSVYEAFKTARSMNKEIAAKFYYPTIGESAE
ncbi:hypothetical protein F4678DRAFT_473524 [Xylaria arbuscula]|nr:hypothetical protein F4678DRAFT_473524 [Xylaria arbuscula]